MLKLLERRIRSVEQRLVLLAPPQAVIPDGFRNVAEDTHGRARWIHEMQAVRGSIYLHEGNVLRDQLEPDGRHHTAEDEQSWHLLMTDSEGRVSSCAWYLEHDEPESIHQLRIRHCPLVHDEEWSERLHGAVRHDITHARNAGLRYSEVGGWAVSAARRCTSEGLVLALAAYGLSRLLGGCIGITTANVTHSSSSILRRIGGSYLEFDGLPMPAYFDHRYNTHIELLRFDSRHPNPKYLGLIDLLKDQLSHVRVIANPVIHSLAACHPVDATAFSGVGADLGRLEPLFAP